ncbi:MAG: hypothetical protein U1F15_04140 [Burkholderiales bacterium]
MHGPIGRQGGWVGMIVLLLAVAIVAFLAKDALMKYGLLSPGQTTVKGAATPGERARSGAAGDVERADPTAAQPAPATAIDRARGVEGFVKQQEGKRGGD